MVKKIIVIATSGEAVIESAPAAVVTQAMVTAAPVVVAPVEATAIANIEVDVLKESMIRCAVL
jgi:hypothetical protein